MYYITSQHHYYYKICIAFSIIKYNPRPHGDVETSMTLITGERGADDFGGDID